MTLIAADYPFGEIVGTMIVFFAWLIWIWAVIAVLGDVFRRDDLGGAGKAGWTFLVIILPFLGLFIYLIGHGKEMAERNVAERKQQEAAFQDYVRKAAGSEGGGDGAAADIERAKKLLDEGTIDQAEYEQLKRKALS
jgi:hypothetical protein